MHRSPSQRLRAGDMAVRLARSSVSEELGEADAHPGPPPSVNGRRPAANGRHATQSQVRAIHAIASRNGVALPELLRVRYQVDRPAALSLREASELIDSRKSDAARVGGRR